MKQERFLNISVFIFLAFITPPAISAIHSQQPTSDKLTVSKTLSRSAIMVATWRAKQHPHSNRGQRFRNLPVQDAHDATAQFPSVTGRPVAAASDPAHPRQESTHGPLLWRLQHSIIRTRPLTALCCHQPGS